MRELLLLRHAEAVSGIPDSERPLTARGEHQARAVGEWLAAQAITLDCVLCSRALRARTTAALALAALATPPPVTCLEAVYGAMPGQLLALLDQHARGERVLLVGHNPGLQYLVATLCPNMPPHQSMSPATLARIVLDGPAEPGRGQLTCFRTG